MSDPIVSSSAKSYMDFSGLGELRGKAQQGDDRALRETAQQFEALPVLDVVQDFFQFTTQPGQRKPSGAERNAHAGLLDVPQRGVQLRQRGNVKAINPRIAVLDAGASPYCGIVDNGKSSGCCHDELRRRVFQPSF